MRDKYTCKTILLLCALCVAFVQACKDDVGADGQSDEFRLINEEAITLQDAGEVKNAYRHLDSSFHVLQPQNKLDRFAFYESSYNYFRREENDNNTALRYADSMLQIFAADSSGKYSDLVSRAYSSKGDALLSLGRYEEAFSNYYEGKIRINKDDKCALADHDYRLAMVLYKQERYTNAAAYFKQSLDNIGTCDESFIRFYRQQEVLDNIGLSYFYGGHTDSAIVYYKECIALLDENEPKFPVSRRILMEQARAVVLSNLATAYNKKGKYEEAEDLLKQSIALNTRSGVDKQEIQSNRLKLAKTYIETDKPDAALPLLTEIKQVLDSYYYDNVALDYHKVTASYYDKKGRPQEAYDALKAYTTLKLSIDEKKRKLIEIDINGRLDNLQKEERIKRLAQSNQQKQEYVVLLLIGAVMSIVIGFLIVRNWRRSRHNVEVLSRLNKHVKDQNKKLEETLGALAVSNKEKDRILRAVSHDIRNPILAVSSLSELMLIDIETLPEEHREYVTLIQEACSHALIISNDLLEVSGKAVQMEKDYVDLNALLKSCINLLRFRAEQKKQKLLLEKNTAGSADAYINKEKVMRVISNIITNAIKFTPEGGVITVGTTVSETDAIISIKDDGIGIPTEYRDKIFDTFTEAKRPGTDGEKPFGLGLSISKQIVEAHDGRIWFESEPDKGTTFYISIPRN